MASNAYLAIKFKTVKIQDLFQKAIRFAGERHGHQKLPGSEASYLVHLANVAMEVTFAAGHTPGFDLEFAIQVALLHDLLEDTKTTYQEIATGFSPRIAEAVLALTRNEALPRERQIPDSLLRIRKQPKEVWSVKLADRISNMQEPPSGWNVEKRKSYQSTARNILEELKGGNAYLEKRLQKKIDSYEQFLH